MGKDMTSSSREAHDYSNFGNHGPPYQQAEPYYPHFNAELSFKEETPVVFQNQNQNQSPHHTQFSPQQPQQPHNQRIHSQEYHRSGSGYFEGEVKPQNDDDDGLGYFSNRTSSSVPSSRIDHYYNDTLMQQQLAQLLQQQQHQQLNEQNQQQHHQNQTPQQHLSLPQQQPTQPAQPSQSQPSQSQQQNDQQYLLSHPHSNQNYQTTPYKRSPLSREQEWAPTNSQTMDNSTGNPIPSRGTSQDVKTSFPPRPQSIRQQSLPVFNKQSTNMTQVQPSLIRELAGESVNSLMGFNPQTIYYNKDNTIRVNPDPSGNETILEKPSDLDMKPKAKRGRPKKNPGFFIKLDSINKRPVTRQVKSSQSDSGTDYWNRSSGGGLLHRALSFTPSQPIVQQGQEDPDPQSELQFLEQDLQLTDDPYGLNIPSFNLTPSAEPPKSVGVVPSNLPPSGYFELENSTTVVNTGQFFSPGIDGHENNINSFNQTFEDYLKSTQLKTEDDANSGTTKSFSEEQTNPITANFTEFEYGASLPQQQQQAPPPQPEQQQVPHQMLPQVPFFCEPVTSIDSSQAYGSSTNESFLSPPNDHQTNVSSGENSDHDHEDNYYVQTTNTLPRSGSNQSVSSGGSGNSGGEDIDIAFANTSGAGNTSKPKKRLSKGAKCAICGKYISRDMTRHIRIHNEVGRFQCVYPKYMCNHRTQYFNRPYDYKKHLLHSHFKFDDPKGKTAHTLTDKLPMLGRCAACGVRFTASRWLDFHVLVNDRNQRCPYIEEKDG